MNLHPAPCVSACVDMGIAGDSLVGWQSALHPLDSVTSLSGPRKPRARARAATWAHGATNQSRRRHFYWLLVCVWSRRSRALRHQSPAGPGATRPLAPRDRRKYHRDRCFCCLPAHPPPTHPLPSFPASARLRSAGSRGRGRAPGRAAAVACRSISSRAGSCSLPPPRGGSRAGERSRFSLRGLRRRRRRGRRAPLLSGRGACAPRRRSPTSRRRDRDLPVRMAGRRRGGGGGGSSRVRRGRSGGREGACRPWRRRPSGSGRCTRTATRWGGRSSAGAWWSG